MLSNGENVTLDEVKEMLNECDLHHNGKPKLVAQYDRCSGRATCLLGANVTHRHTPLHFSPPRPPPSFLPFDGTSNPRDWPGFINFEDFRKAMGSEVTEDDES